MKNKNDRKNAAIKMIQTYTAKTQHNKKWAQNAPII